jgi:hypothetical protein
MIAKRVKRGGKIFDFDKGEGLIVGTTMEEWKAILEEKHNKWKIIDSPTINEEFKEVPIEFLNVKESTTS